MEKKAIAELPLQKSKCCSCDAPKCKECGLSVLRNSHKDAAKKKLNIEPQDLEDLLNGFVQDNCIDLPDVKRAVSRVCKAYSSLGEETFCRVSQLSDKKEIFKLLYEKVTGEGAGNIEPLQALLKLLQTSVAGEDDEITQSCYELSTEMLKLPCSIECSSPPGTPQPFNSNGMVLFLCPGSSKCSTP